MAPLDVIAIEQEGRRLRAEDLRRGEPVFAQRGALYVHLFGESLRGLTSGLSDALRLLFSWNPRQRMS